MQRHLNQFYPGRNPESPLAEDRREFLENASISLGLPSLFYASLRHPRVFEAVVGRRIQRDEWEPVAAPGFHPRLVTAGTGFPGAFPSNDTPDALLDAVMMHGLSRFEQTMIAWYEWDEYELRPVRLMDGRMAQAFLPDLDAIEAEHGSFSTEPWSFEEWEANHVDRAVAIARDWMAQRPSDRDLIEAGCFDPDETPAERRAAG